MSYKQSYRYPSELISIHLFLTGYLISLFVKILPILELLSLLPFILCYFILLIRLISTVNFKNHLIVLGFTLIFILQCVQKPFYVNDLIRLNLNILLFTVPSKTLHIKWKNLYKTVFIFLFLVQAIDFFVVLFPREITVKNDALGLFRAGNEFAVYTCIVLLLGSNKMNFILSLISGLFSSVKFSIFLPLYKIFSKRSKKGLLAIVILIPLVVYILLLNNKELNYLLSNQSIGLLSIITSFRFDRLLDNWQTLFGEISSIAYYEMDLIDLFQMTGYTSLIIYTYLFRKLYLLFVRAKSLWIYLPLFLYSFFFGHVIFSTTFGLLIITLKFLLNENNKSDIQLH